MCRRSSPRGSAPAFPANGPFKPRRRVAAAVSRRVQAMFTDIAGRYDRTNTVLSLGVHRAWRRRAVRAAGLVPGARVLDVATGTGDLALAFHRRLGAHGRVVGVDFSKGMLRVAAGKAYGRVDLVSADGLALPVPDGAFDVASIAFGIRNLDDPKAGVAELARAVGSGGRVVVLEFGQPRGPVGVPYRWYSRHVMPRVGGLLTGNRAAYEYLPDTASRFPAGATFVALMEGAADFRHVQAWPLTGGIAWLYVGTVA